MTSENDDKTQGFTALTPGTEVRHYRIVEKIGAGGMGEVYLADDTKLSRRVALKFLPAHVAGDEQVRARFTREAQAAAKLDHPNIVTIYEVEDFNGRPFFAMQYVAGHTLHHYCHDDGLGIEEIGRLILQVADGLAGAHTAGVVHRDIKSSNVIVDADRRARILDFGLATVRGTEMITKAGSTLGTIAYMSPEQAQGRALDHRSDIFSLGVVLYELLTGRTPFRRDSEAAILNAIINDAPEPVARFRSDVPEDVQRIVTKCLAKREDERYQSAADLAADLRSFVRSLESDRSITTGRSATGQPSIAVLPFANMSADPENEFFADGLTEELLNVLARNPELRVTGRTSSFAFKGKQEDLREIGQKLGVGTLLEGSVRKAGNRVRITAQLVNTQDGFHIWSDTYDRVLEDIFAVQDDIAQAVAGALHVSLLGANTTEYVCNPESLELTMKARPLLRQFTDESINRAKELLEKAIEIDADNAQAWSGLGRAHTVLAAYGMGDLRDADIEEHYRKGKAAVQRALELDNQLAEAYEGLSWIRAAFEYHFDEAFRLISKAHDLSPNNSGIVSSLSMHHAITRKFDAASKLAAKATELDPLNPEAHFILAKILMWAGDFERALAAGQRVRAITPEMSSLNFTLGCILMWQGRFEEAVDFARREKLDGYRYCGLAIVFHEMGREADSNEAMENLLACDSHWGFQFAMAHACRNERDEAFSWLERSIALRDAGIPATYASPFLKNLHDDPRWPRLLRRIGLA